MSTGGALGPRARNIGRGIATGALKVGLVLAVAWSLIQAVQGAPEQRLAGHVPAAVVADRALAPLSGDKRLKLAVGLPLRNTEALNALLEDLYNPQSPAYHQYLSVEQFTQQFGPSQEDYQAVAAFLTDHGFKITATFANRLLIDVEAAVPDIERTFHLKLRQYQHPTEARAFFAPDSEPSIEFAVPLLHISGLDDYVLPRPASLHQRPRPLDAQPQTGSGPAGSYKGFDFRAAYAPGVTLTGAGQYVGLLQFDGYYVSDIYAYAASAGLYTNVPLQNVLLDGSTGAPGANNVEVALDIEMTLSMAPGLAGIIVYEGSFGDDILNRMAVDNVAKQLSASWTYGNTANTTQIFQEFLAQGQAYFNASGDSGAYTTSVPTPTDNPYVISVGGTTLSTRGPVQGYISETTWSWFTSGQGSGASSGGVSPRWTIPTWQQPINMTTNHGSSTMRNLPDVSMVSDNVFVIADNGQQEFVGGDSVATPLWAGFLALANQQAAALGQPPVGFINPAIYAIAQTTNYANCFHDIRTGNNTNFISPTLYYATNGYDLCTGLGSPTGRSLINALAPPPNARLIIGPAATLTTETCSGPNGAVDPGEAVIMNLSLQNIGGIGTTNLVATLLNTGGVVAASAPQSYGVLTNGGPAVARSFVFTPTGVCGGIINPTLQLQDGAANLGNVAFTVPLGAPIYALTQSFDSVTAPSLPPGWTRTGSGGSSNWLTTTSFRYTTNNSAMAVGSPAAGFADLLSPAFSITTPSAVLTFRNSYVTELNTTNASDGFDGGLLEISIGGGAFTDILAAGGSFVTGGYNATLDATTGNPFGGRQSWSGTSGGFILTTVNLPASAAGQSVQLKWRLATDTENGAGATIWCIDSVAVKDGASCCSPATNADLAIFQTASPVPALVGQNLGYSLIASNFGPAAATSITITDTLPANVTFVSASPGCVNTGGVVICYAALIVNNGRTNFIINVTPNSDGSLTNTLSIGSSVSDTNSANSASISVTPAYTAPVITMPPSNQVVAVGANTAFNVTATGTAPLAFQWQFAGTNIDGATFSTLSLTNVQLSQAGSYMIIVTNLSGSVASASATLRVLLPATLSLSRLNVTPTNVSLSLSSVAGQDYLLEYKNSLFDPQWTPLPPPQTGTGGPLILQDTNALPFPSRFYRVNSY
jgi:uncharacterized repeat protein (TIGR01451 family)